VGTAATTATAVGARGSGDVEPDCQWLGILEQRSMDSDLSVSTSNSGATAKSILKIKMITVQVNGNEMAWVCENHFGTEPNVQNH
jgi:hypothetical protein